MKSMLWIAATALAVALLAGCGGGTETETAGEPAPASEHVNTRTLHLTLDGKPGPENVGVLMAESRGYFDDAGLKVEVSPPERPFRPVEYVAGGTVELGVSHEPEVVLAQQEGVPIVAIGSLVSQPTAAMIWLKKSGIGGIADLKGKTIAIPGLRFQRDFLQSVLARAGLTLDDVKVRSVGYGLLPALVSGRADAIFGGSWNVEGAALDARGLSPVVTRARDLGVPSYEELVVIARPSWLARNPQSTRDFMSALARGTAAAIEDPRAAAGEIAVAAKPRAIEERVKETLPLLSATGRMSAKQADQLAGWMREEGMIQQAPSASKLLTNRYLEP